MQQNGHVRTPSLSQFTPAGNHHHHSYSSSSNSSYGGLRSHSRSESGTSQTNYDDHLATPPPPRALMEEYTRSDNGVIQESPPKSAASFRSLDPSARDPMAMHLLFEDAVDDCKDFEILSPEELRRLKKEQELLSRKIQSAKRKLHLQSRLRNTAQALQRLDSKPPSKYNPRSSLGKRRTSGGSEIVPTPEAEDLETLTNKCEELAQQLWKLEKRHSELHERRLRHTAAVLQLHCQSESQTARNQKSAGLDEFGDEDEDDDNDELQLDSLDAAFGAAPRNLKPRLESLSRDLYDLVSHSGPYSKAGFTVPPGTEVDTDDCLAYVEMSLNTVKGLYEGLVKYSEQSVDKVRRFEQMNAVVTGLWDVVVAGDAELKQSMKSAWDLTKDEKDIEEDDSSDSESDENEEFSIQAFSMKIQGLCERATTMSEQHSSLRQQGADREEMEAEIVRLQTEVTVARAELDGAYGTRAQRALEGQLNPETQKDLEEAIAKNSELLQQKADAEQRADVLQKELKELAPEYESLVKQGVEAEKDREALEALVDQLKQRIEEVEAKLSDEKVKIMGRINGEANSGGGSGRPNESTSMSVMRSEFKKMMRDARGEHFKSLRAEQDERRRLEAIIRNLRKEQSTASSSAALSPPLPSKSSQGKTVAAPSAASR